MHSSKEQPPTSSLPDEPPTSSSPGRRRNGSSESISTTSGGSVFSLSLFRARNNPDAAPARCLHFFEELRRSPRTTCTKLAADIRQGAAKTQCQGCCLFLLLLLLLLLLLIPSSTNQSPAANGCTNECNYQGDRECDDGGPGSEFNYCGLGHDCQDCGSREVFEPPLPPLPPLPSSPSWPLHSTCYVTPCGLSNGTCADFIDHFSCNHFDYIGCACRPCCLETNATMPPALPPLSPPPPPQPWEPTNAVNAALLLFLVSCILSAAILILIPILWLKEWLKTGEPFSDYVTNVTGYWLETLVPIIWKCVRPHQMKRRSMQLAVLAVTTVWVTFNVIGLVLSFPVLFGPSSALSEPTAAQMTCAFIGSIPFFNFLLVQAFQLTIATVERLGHVCDFSGVRHRATREEREASQEAEHDVSAQKYRGICIFRFLSADFILDEALCNSYCVIDEPTKWKLLGTAKPSVGEEIVNEHLSAALLENKLEFSRADLEDLQIRVRAVRTTGFVKAGEFYYAPHGVGSLPRFQELYEQVPEHFSELEVSEIDAYRGKYADHYLAISHAWDSSSSPDFTGTQLENIRSFLRNNRAEDDEAKRIRWVWYDFWSLYQSPRTKGEDIRFKYCLDNMSQLYLGCRVLALVGRTSQGRFWPQFELWLGLQKPDERGLVPAKARISNNKSVRAHGKAIHGANDAMAAALVEKWELLGPDEAYEALAAPDVLVTNRKDKDTQLQKLRSLAKQVKAAALAPLASLDDKSTTKRLRERTEKSRGGAEIETVVV